MNEQLAPVAVDYGDTLIERLLGHYLSNTPVPGRPDGLTPELIHRLCRAIRGEGYGSRTADAGDS
jgi:hypothetical protein